MKQLTFEQTILSYNMEEDLLFQEDHLHFILHLVMGKQLPETKETKTTKWMHVLDEEIQ